MCSERDNFRHADKKGKRGAKIKQGRVFSRYIVSAYKSDKTENEATHSNIQGWGFFSSNARKISKKLQMKETNVVFLINEQKQKLDSTLAIKKSVCHLNSQRF